MKKVRGWEQNLEQYPELVGIECRNFNPSVIKIVEQLSLPDLRKCPCTLIDTTIIVPKEALYFLSLRCVEYVLKKVKNNERGVK